MGEDLAGAWKSGGGGSSDNPIEFLRVADGESVDVRVVGSGKPRDVFRHRFILNEKAYYAACPGKKNDCPACKAGQKLEHTNVVTVIDRRDKRVKLWEFSNEKRDDIAVLVNNKDYGDPRGYDLQITRRGQKLKTRYTIFPGTNRQPLTDGEKALLVPNLEEYYKPNVDRIQSLLKGEVPKRRQAEEPEAAAGAAATSPNPLADDTAATV